MDINHFLSWLVGSGGSIMASSWILERVAWFQSQTANVKEGVFFGLASLFSVGAYLTITYVPTTTLDAIGPFFLILAGLFSTIIVGKIFHTEDKK